MSVVRKNISCFGLSFFWSMTRPAIVPIRFNWWSTDLAKSLYNVILKLSFLQPGPSTVFSSKENHHIWSPTLAQRIGFVVSQTNILPDKCPSMGSIIFFDRIPYSYDAKIYKPNGVSCSIDVFIYWINCNGGLRIDGLVQAISCSWNCSNCWQPFY